MADPRGFEEEVKQIRIIDKALEELKAERTKLDQEMNALRANASDTSIEEERMKQLLDDNFGAIKGHVIYIDQCLDAHARMKAQGVTQFLLSEEKCYYGECHLRCSRIHEEWKDIVRYQ